MSVQTHYIQFIFVQIWRNSLAPFQRHHTRLLYLCAGDSRGQRRYVPTLSAEAFIRLILVRAQELIYILKTDTNVV